jgi:hypothetical protein
MSGVLLGFSHDSSDWISRLFSWITFGGPSHVVLISPDRKWFIESTALRKPAGVQPPAPIAEFLAKPRAEIRQIDHPDPKAVWNAALTLVGQGYDWGWLFGWLVRSRRWDDPGRWVCAEAITWAMAKTGRGLFSPADTWHITPGDLYMMSVLVEGK